MEKLLIFASLAKETSPVLLALLDAAYDEMTVDQRHIVFG